MAPQEHAASHKGDHLKAAVTTVDVVTCHMGNHLAVVSKNAVNNKHGGELA